MNSTLPALQNSTQTANAAILAITLTGLLALVALTASLIVSAMPAQPLPLMLSQASMLLPAVG